MDRRTFLSTGLGALAQPPVKRPNIVLILLDDLGYGDFGCYGQQLIQTPNIDGAASEGRRFTQCYAGGTVCAPSRSVLMTGLHTGHSPVRANAGTVPLEPDDFTVASLFQRAGYRTGAFGKWGLGDIDSTGVPWKHGFDQFFGYLHQTHAHTYYPAYLWDNGRRVEMPGNRGGARGQYSASLIADRTFSFLERQDARPFFLYAAWTLPHGRFEIPSVAPYEKESWTDGQKAYAAMISLADSHVGRVLEILRKRKLDENTKVFITSDNGGTQGPESLPFFRSNGALRGQKGEMYEGGIRVPMIVQGPGVPRGSESSYPWAFCDFLPTAAAVAGEKPPGGLDGMNVLPALLAQGEPRREFLYWEQNIFDMKTWAMRHERRAQALRMGTWKAVRPRGGAPLELYDLAHDPAEQRDLASSQPEVVRRAEQLLEREHKAPRPHTNGRAWDWNTESGIRREAE